MGRAVGIDLGTTFSLVAVMEAGEPMIIPSLQGERVTPSVVAVSKKGERLVGWLAKRQAVLNAENTVFSVKRLIGRRFTDATVQADIQRLPYRVVAGANGEALVTFDDRDCSPPEISAMILHSLKADAEAYLSESVTDAVITVPAYFSDGQRQATKDAGAIAGLNVLRIISEPTAAALAYGMNRTDSRTLAVYDLGGGTFDISILEMKEGSFVVKASNGDTHLGGDDFDSRIVEWVCQDFKRQNNIDLHKDKLGLQRVRDASERAKQELSTMEETEINLPYIAADDAGPKHLVVTLTRSKLEELVSDLILKTIDPCRRALEDAHLKVTDLDELLLVGGSTRMPRVQLEVAHFFGKEPHKGAHPDEAVALGAAIQAGVLSGEVKDIVLHDVTPLTLGIRVLGGKMACVIPRNTAIPTSMTRIFSTADDMQGSMDILVLQGEHNVADRNTLLGCFTLQGIRPARHGVPQIGVTFEIDANGILHVSARDKDSGNEQMVTITASSGMSKEDIARAAAEVETRGRADALVHRAEKHLRDVGGKIAPELKKQIEEKMAALKAALRGRDLTVINEGVQQLLAALPEVPGASPLPEAVPEGAPAASQA